MPERLRGQVGIPLCAGRTRRRFEKLLLLSLPVKSFSTFLGARSSPQWRVLTRTSAWEEREERRTFSLRILSTDVAAYVEVHTLNPKRLVRNVSKVSSVDTCPFSRANSRSVIISRAPSASYSLEGQDPRRLSENFVFPIRRDGTRSRSRRNLLTKSNR